MAESGRLLASVFSYLDSLNLIGMSTMQVNDLVDSFIVNELQAATDGKLSAQFEHTVAVTSNGVRVLTLRPGEKAPA